VLALAEAMSLERPTNGWFVPNCAVGLAGRDGLLSQQGATERRSVRVPLLDDEDEDVNALQALNNWLTTGEKHQAIDPFGLANAACGVQEEEQRSQPLLDLRPPVTSEVEELEAVVDAGVAALRNRDNGEVLI
jgi:hypothetical protein